MARPPKKDYVPLMIAAAKRRLLAGEEVRVTDIATELGVSGPLVHYYFTDRQELVDAAWRDILHAFVADDHEETRQYASATDWEGVQALIERVFAPQRDAVHVAHLRAAVEAMSSEELTATVTDVHEATIAGWQELLEAAMADGVVRTDLDPRAVAILVVSISLGVTAVLPELARTDRRNVATTWATMLRAVLDPTFDPHADG